jgi:hypothetical protein
MVVNQSERARELFDAPAGGATATRIRPSPVFSTRRSTGDRLVLTWSLERDWITRDVDLTRMHAAVASSAGRDPGRQSSLGKF